MFSTDRGLRAVGWCSLIVAVVSLFLLIAGIGGRVCGVVLFASLAVPTIVAGAHVGRSQAMAEKRRERWLTGLLRFGPFAALLYLIIKDRDGTRKARG